MSPGQLLALRQVEAIAQSTTTIEVVAIQRPTEQESRLVLDISLFTGDMEHQPTGLALRDRERIKVWIDADFPYSYPHVSVDHRRFAGFPHVQWGSTLCMFQAPSTEWSPRMGMVSFLARVESWFRMAAADQLDPTDGALHPPVTYPSSTVTTPMVLARRNAPAVAANEAWLGFSDLETPSERRVDIVGWSQDESTLTHLAAPTVLLHQDMPFEFPVTVDGILKCLELRGVARASVFRILQRALVRNGGGKPLFVVIGTPMRGVRGGERKQHLTVWKVDDLTVKMLALEKLAADLGETVAALHQEIVELFESWVPHAKVAWCRVREDRPEVTVSRDVGTPLEAFRGKKVEVWGCGALGSHVSEMLVRAGVASIRVRDYAAVAPGVIARQQYTDKQIGQLKCVAMATRLMSIRPSCTVDFEVDDILVSPLGSDRLSDDAEIVIDTTASVSVLMKTEEVWRRASQARRTLASVVIDGTARRLMAVVVRPTHSGGPYDVTRRLKLAACDDPELAGFRDAFFPIVAPKPFQPEPGCSDATFVGSAADVAGLASMLLNFVGEELQRAGGSETAAGAFGPSAVGAGGVRSLTRRLGFEPDLCFRDPHTEFETRVTRSAWQEMQAWVAESARVRGTKDETGGLLFGEADELLKIMWVSEVSGPPPDSKHSPELFICGIDGTVELAAEKRKRSQGSALYIGTWHIHPVSVAQPSGQDLNAMQILLTSVEKPPDRLLLFIVGTPTTEPTVSASVFLRSEFEIARSTGIFLRTVHVANVNPPNRAAVRDVGLALSGGGSRAMAFQLGCLRALHDRGVLSRVDVLSTVSGGSVLGAMYAYSTDSFEDFDRRVVSTLRRGFAGAIARRTFLSPRMLRILASQVVSGIPANCAFIARKAVGIVESHVGRSSKATGLRAGRIQPPFRRWASRTDAFIATLRDRVFGNLGLDSPRRDGVNIVINACELRTGTAFRFGNRESGTWRYGIVDPKEMDVALAVAASAAYPMLLPAIDRRFSCTKTGEEAQDRRLILTDGGVYDNLGLTCLEPGKYATYSTNVYQPKYIISCDAGRGELDDTVLPYGMLTRMTRAFGATHRQVQHGLQGKLHLWQQSGLIDGFVYAYLGQRDERLPAVPADFVRRDDVKHYPTDFSAMSESDIALLAKRGYQLTRLLLAHYCSEL